MKEGELRRVIADGERDLGDLERQRKRLAAELADAERNVADLRARLDLTASRIRVLDAMNEAARGQLRIMERAAMGETARRIVLAVALPAARA